MKLLKICLALSLLCFIVGCATVQNTAGNKMIEANEQAVAKEIQKLCILTATPEPSDKYFMIEELFSNEIPCETNDDCFNILTQKDDYRKLAPEFEPYLNCEIADGPIEPMII
ncbi:MAG: hypothetical protein ABIJ08_01220 [Nanoarchaeota archaeon]